jgi:lipopolysaccharide transport system ATP-binding protein
MFRPGTGEWRFTEVVPIKPVFYPDEPKEFVFKAAPTRPNAGPVYLSGLLVNEEGTVLTQLDSRLTGMPSPRSEAVQGRLRIAGLWLKPGKYNLDLYLCTLSDIVDRFERSAEFEVSPVLPYPQTASTDATASALVLADFDWKLDA